MAGVSLALMHAAAFSAVAAALSAGSIVCVGLIAPHALRLMGITRHRWVVPLVVLLGGSLLTIADTV